MKIVKLLNGYTTSITLISWDAKMYFQHFIDLKEQHSNNLFYKNIETIQFDTFNLTVCNRHFNLETLSSGSRVVSLNMHFKETDSRRLNTRDTILVSVVLKSRKLDFQVLSMSISSKPIKNFAIANP